MPDDLSGYEIVDHLGIGHDPADCNICIALAQQEREEEEQRLEAERLLHLRRVLKLRRFCLRARVVALLLMGVSFVVVPWWSFFTMGVGTIALVAGVQSDQRAIASARAELGTLELPEARLVRAGD